MDKKSGYGVYEWENGWVYKGNFENDYRNGYGELYEGDVCVYRGFWENGEQSDREKPIGKISSKANTSAQMSRISKQINQQNPEQRHYETLDLHQQYTKINFEPRLTSRPEFTIKKRPQSYSNLQK